MATDKVKRVFVSFRMTEAERERLQLLATRSGGRSQLLRKLIDAELRKHPALLAETTNLQTAEHRG